MTTENIKETLIQTTMDFIRRDDKNITVRSITTAAGVTQGLINYHFQSKENLIQIATQRVIDETITKVPNMIAQIDGTPETKLRAMIKLTLQFLMEHPHIAKISILRDLRDPKPDDNMQSSIDAYDRLLQQITDDPEKRFMAGHVLCSACQSFFLRCGLISEKQAVGAQAAQVQAAFVDGLVDMVFKGLEMGEHHAA